MMKWKNQSELTAINIVNAIAAAFLFVSPWLFGFSGEQTVSWNAWIGGLLIAALALAAMVELQEWEEWVNLALGCGLRLRPGCWGLPPPSMPCGPMLAWALPSRSWRASSCG
jgi:hypothetical protein